MVLKGLTMMAAVVVMQGCSTVTINPEFSGKLSTEPTYEQRKSFFFAGLVGEQRVDVVEVCNGRPVEQMQSQQTFVDGLLTGLTLGIYAPHTVKVWCQ